MSADRPTKLGFYPRWVNGELRPPQTVDFNGRKLLVVDPDDWEQVERLTDQFYRERRLGEPYVSESNYRNMRAALRRLADPPEVYEHFSEAHLKDVGSGTTLALCGKVWRATPNVAVVGKCPECVALVGKGWIA